MLEKSLWSVDNDNDIPDIGDHIETRHIQFSQKILFCQSYIIVISIAIFGEFPPPPTKTVPAALPF